MRRKFRILVTGAGGDSGISTIRILKENGFYVHACDCSELSSGLYLADSYSIIPYASDEKNFLKSIIRIVKEKDIYAIFPQVDEELKLFAKYKGKFGAKVIISPLETVEICQNKLYALEFLKGTIPIPRTNIKDESFPLVVRPTVSRGSRNVYITRNEQEKAFFGQYIKNQELIPMTQEYLTGKEYTVDALCDFFGNLIVASPRERLATKGSVCSIGKSIKNQKIISLVEKITKKLKFFGPINIQFREDGNGILKLLEVNPRSSGGSMITYKNGLNIPLLALKLLERKKITQKELNYKEKTIFRYLTEI